MLYVACWHTLVQMPAKKEQFCYLLRSQHPKHRHRVYVGVTDDLERRLRQHNKGKKAGGGKYTHMFRPWVHEGVVSGFGTDRSLALSFESACKHPEYPKHKAMFVGHGRVPATRKERLLYLISLPRFSHLVISVSDCVPNFVGASQRLVG